MLVSVATNVANCGAVLFEDFVYVLRVLLSTFFGERRNRNPDHSSVIGRIQAEVGRPDGFIDRAD
jgi:hypothetical protein